MYVECVPRVDIHQWNRFPPVSVGPSRRRASSHSDPVALGHRCSTPMLSYGLFCFGLTKSIIFRPKLIILHIKMDKMEHCKDFSMSALPDIVLHIVALKKKRSHLKVCECGQGQTSRTNASGRHSRNLILSTSFANQQPFLHSGGWFISKVCLRKCSSQVRTLKFKLWIISITQKRLIS